jgi:hypothetical protein
MAEQARKYENKPGTPGGANRDADQRDRKDDNDRRRQNDPDATGAQARSTPHPQWRQGQTELGERHADQNRPPSDEDEINPAGSAPGDEMDRDETGRTPGERGGRREPSEQRPR